MFGRSPVNAFPRGLLAAALMAVFALAGTARGAELRLLMIEQPGCEWCEAWQAEVGVVYARTAEGRAAPLLRSMIYDPLPEGVTLARPARYTPTFVLLVDGREVGRIEGYPGEDFFYGLLQRLITRARRAAGAVPSAVSAQSPPGG